MLTGAENWHRPTYVRPQRESAPAATRAAATTGTEARVIHFNNAAVRASTRSRGLGAESARRSPLFTPAPVEIGAGNAAPSGSSQADRALRAQLLGQLAAAQSQASALVAVRQVEEQSRLSSGRSVARAQVRRGLQQASAAVGGVRRSRADDLRRAALRLITGR